MELYHTFTPLASGCYLWAWSKGLHARPLLACAHAPNSVHVYAAEGRTLNSPAHAVIKNVRASNAADLAWNPQLSLLSIGWRDGAISLWDANTGHMEEDSKSHRCAICSIVWSNDGLRFLTCDAQSKLSAWRTDKGLRPVLLCQFEEKGQSIAHCVWGSSSAVFAPADGRPTYTAYFLAGAPESNTPTIKWLDDHGRSGVVQDLGEPQMCLLHYQERDQVVALSTSGNLLLLGHCEDGPSQIGDSGAHPWVVLLRMKFASGPGMQATWAGPHVLATASLVEPLVRLFDFDAEANHALAVDSKEFTSQGQAMLRKEDPESRGICCLSWHPVQSMLAAGTVDGVLYIYRRQKLAASSEAAGITQLWEAQHCFQVGRNPSRIDWGSTARFLATGCADGLYISSKALLHHKVAEGLVAVQVSADQVVLEQLGEGGPRSPARVRTQLTLAGLDVTPGALLLHDGTHAEVYCLTPDNELELQAQFECAAPRKGGGAMALRGESVYRTGQDCIEVCNMAGTVKQTLPLDPAQGQPQLLYTNREYLAVATSQAVVRVFKLSGREARPHAGPGLLVPEGVLQQVGIASICMNSTGTIVAALANRIQQQVADGAGSSSNSSARDSRLFVYCSDTNSCSVHDFGEDGKVPYICSWDAQDPRLLAVQVQGEEFGSSSTSRDIGVQSAGATESTSGDTNPQPSSWDTSTSSSRSGMNVALLWASPEHGLLLQEYQDLEAAGTAGGFLGIAVPNLLVNKKTLVARPGVAPFTTNITRVPLQGFTGITDADAGVRSALLDFSFNLAVGRHEEAFRAVAALRSPAVWRAMAHMAIKSKRLDVAEHCLGNMEHVKGARALREAMANIPELDARVGLVAVHLGLKEDAQRLFAGAGRWDLLNQLHQAEGNWAAALEVAQKHDRMHLNVTRHAYAQHLEACGDHKAALDQYMACKTGAAEVPRLLWILGRTDELERYVLSQGEVELLTWWARFSESQGDFDKALACYQRTRNYLAMLRIHCATENYTAAEELVSRTQDPAAAFHLARLYEAQGRIDDALRHYGISKRYSHGARLAMRQEAWQELRALALQSPPEVQLEAADCLLAAGQVAAAAQLYQAAGKLAKALDMALSSGLVEVLEAVAVQLGAHGDPEVVAKCAESFLSAGLYDKAVALFARCGQQQEALDLILQQEVPLTEELAEALTPEKTEHNTEARTATLLQLAQLAKQQGLYHLACKKYTQAGDRLKAMKALVKSRDTDKIVFFAGVSRQREVFIMAANYLQTLDWHSSPELMKNIVTFYSKAGAYTNLAGFYQACAQLEVDEFKDYDKALQALQEASKQLSKARGDNKEAQMQLLAQKQANCERFIEARQTLASDPARAVAICQAMLAEAPEGAQGADWGVCIGDVYALLVEWCYHQGNADQALQLLRQMEARGLAPVPYVDADMVAAIYKAMGVQAKPSQHAFAKPSQGQLQRGTAEEVQEELPYIADDTL